MANKGEVKDTELKTKEKKKILKRQKKRSKGEQLTNKGKVVKKVLVQVSYVL
jgi:hypothetical protein